MKYKPITTVAFIAANLFTFPIYSQTKNNDTTKMTTPNFSKTPKVQGQNEIIINAPLSVVWPLIKDSKRLLDWGPPVQDIEVYLAPGQTEEGAGSKRKVVAKFSEKRKGWYQEIRTEHIEGRKITFHIYEDSFGMSKILYDVGGSMEVVPEGNDKTRFIFTFYHRTKGFMGWLMNPMIKMDQKKNRKKAMLSLKQYVENGKGIKN